MKKTGDNYLDSEAFHDMLNEYEHAVNTGQPVFLDADELAEIADYYQMSDQDEEAEKAIQLALNLSPGAIAPLTFRIHEALYHGDTESARSFLDQIIERDEPDYIYNKAEILISEGRIDECDEYLREEFKKVPQEEYQDYVIDVASIYSDYGVNEKAMEWMVRAKQEDTPDFKELMARTLFGLGKYQDSARLFNELIDVNPFSTRYWNELASAQFMNEDYSNSVQSSEFSIAIDPENPEGIISKANGLYRLENYEEALNYFRRYSELVPEDEFALLHQGTCLINLARNEEAHQMLLQAIEVAPEDSPYLCDIYQELAFVLSEEGKTDEAMEYINKTDDLDCDHIQMLIVKGHIALAGHRKEESENYFHQAIQDSDYSLNVIMRVCVSLYENHYVAGAYSLFQQLFSGAPEEFDEGFAYMALCCYELKKNEEFLHFLEIACKRNPKECKMVLSDLFPKDLAPELYYDYIKNQQK